MRGPSSVRLGLALFVLAACGLALGLGAARLRPGVGAVPWTVELTMTVSGQYRVTGRTGPLTGDYSFTVLWKGTLEPDDVDWRLVHKSCDVLHWKAEERPAPQTRGQVVTDADISDKPVFHFRYVLQDQGQVQFDFGTEGFPIPLGNSPNKFQLILPRSARTGRGSGEPNYDGFLIKGSNRVAIPESDLGTEPIDRTFDWSWAGNQSILEQDVTIVCRQTHQVHLRLVLLPRTH